MISWQQPRRRPRRLAGLLADLREAAGVALPIGLALAALAAAQAALAQLGAH